MLLEMTGVQDSTKSVPSSSIVNTDTTAEAKNGDSATGAADGMSIDP